MKGTGIKQGMTQIPTSEKKTFFLVYFFILANWTFTKITSKY